MRTDGMKHLLVDMDPSTHPQSPPPYAALPSWYIHENQLPSQKSPALIRCGIALIVTSTLCLISSSILLCLTLSNVACAWFVFTVLYLLTAMQCLYAGFNVEERHQSVVSTLIMGVVSTVGTFPIVIGVCASISFPHNVGAVEKYGIISSILSTINIGLAVAIAIIACKKTCQCCNPAFKPLTSNIV